MCVNNGPNSLHGGKVSWGHVLFLPSLHREKMWQFEKLETADAIGVKMTIVSPDGDENYPGEVTVPTS